MNRPLRHAVFLAAALTANAAVADLTADQTPFHTYRGLWVSRFEYSTNQASVDSVFANAQALGITDVMFQVRGQADAYYNPKQVAGDYFEHRQSSFDSLARAVQQGQQRGIKVHAWLNTMPLWNGTTLPTDTPGNPYVINSHPEYWIRDSSNTPQPLNSSYVIVNPTMPEVKQHIYDVVDDITSKYAVDGIHLDYVRFLNASSGANPIVYPTDPASVARFQSIPGNAGKTPTSHKADYQSWMAANITELVSGIRQTMKSNLPESQLTAAIWRDANIGYNDYQQDWKTWVDRGLLDAGMPMIYRKGFGSGGAGMSSDSGDLYRNNVTAAVNWRGSAGIMPGLGPYMQDDVATAYGNVTAQLNYARDQGANGVQLFSYTDLLGGNAVDVEVRRAWLDFVAANSSAAPIASITNFESDEGYFPSNITFSGSNVNVAATSTADRVTTEAHAGVASQQITINKTAGAGTFLARHVSGIGTPASPASNLTFASIGAIGFWLKTTSADMEVSMALDDRSDNTSTERGYFQNVIPDGQWHLYQWSLDDVSQWDAWAGANVDGTIEQTFTLDSIQIRGSGSVNTMFLDDVFYNAAAIAADQWTLDSAININSPNTNWTNGANWQGGVPNAVGATSNFFRRATAAQAITVDAAITVGALTIDNLVSYTFGGSGSITLDASSGNASLSVRNRGTHNIGVPVRMNDSTDVFVDRAATLNLNGTLEHFAANTLVRLGDGVLNINGSQVGGVGAAFIAQGGVTNFNASQNLNAITVASGATVNFSAGANKLLQAGSMTIAGGMLDLHDNDALLRTTQLAIVENAIASARNDGAWDQSGLTSTSARTQPQQATSLGAIGGSDYLATTGAIFNGVAVAASDVLVKYTWYGDTDLNGVVDFDDYVRIDTGFNAGLQAWFNGDFDYSGGVDFDDYVLIDLAFNAQNGTLIDALNWLEGEDRSAATHAGSCGPGSGCIAPGVEMVIRHYEQFGLEYANAFYAAVPEPSCAVAAVCLGAFALTTRRTRRIVTL